MNLISKKLLAASIFSLFAAITVFPQKATKEEFKKFATAFDQIHNAEQQNQQEIAAVAKAYGFTVEQLFEEDGMARMMATAFPNDPPRQDEKSKRVRTAMAGVKRLENDLKEKRTKAIRINSFSNDRYYAIRAELYKFGSAIREISDINQKWRVEFSALVKENGLTGSRFNELYKAYGNSKATPENEETKKFNAIMLRVEEKNKEMEAQKNKAFADNGFNQEHQKEISTMILADPAWAERLKTILN